MLAKAALMLNVKAILVTHNDQHTKILKRILADFVLSDLKAQSNVALSKFAPADCQARMEALKPARLVKWLNQRKRVPEADSEEQPNAKRKALAANVDSLLGQFDGNSAPVKPKPKAEPKNEVPPVAPKVPPAKASDGPALPAASSQEAPKQPPPAKAEGVAQPAENLAALLKSWA